MEQHEELAKLEDKVRMRTDQFCPPFTASSTISAALVPYVREKYSRDSSLQTQNILASGVPRRTKETHASIPTPRRSVAGETFLRDERGFSDIAEGSTVRGLTENPAIEEQHVISQVLKISQRGNGTYFLPMLPVQAR